MPMYCNRTSGYSSDDDRAHYIAEDEEESRSAQKAMGLDFAGRRHHAEQIEARRNLAMPGQDVKITEVVTIKRKAYIRVDCNLKNHRGLVNASLWGLKSAASGNAGKEGKQGQLDVEFAGKQTGEDGWFWVRGNTLPLSFCKKKVDLAA
eukprot:SAG22_NODE_2268_length_2769_cov_1.823970_2_plen_149_part_00